MGVLWELVNRFIVYHCLSAQPTCMTRALIETVAEIVMPGVLWLLGWEYKCSNVTVFGCLS